MSSMRAARCGTSGEESLSGKFNAHAFRSGRRVSAAGRLGFYAVRPGRSNALIQKSGSTDYHVGPFTIPQSYGNEYMKIAILGSGGVGGYFGARLAASG